MADVLIGGDFRADLLIERGDIYFLYRPKGAGYRQSRQVARLYIVLKPSHKPLYRVLVGDRKDFPGPQEDDAFRFVVSRLFRKPQDVRDELGEKKFETKIYGHKSLPSARPLASGMYAIYMHGNESHFAYAIEMPDGPLELNLKRAVDYCVVAINPKTESAPRSIGPRPQINFSETLRDKFKMRQTAPIDLPDFLEYEGLEIEFMPSGNDGITIEFENRSDGRMADASRDLRLPFELGDDPILEYKLR